MSIDTHVMLKTTFSASEVRHALLQDSQIADLGLARSEDERVIGSERVGLIVKPWVENDRDLIEDGFQTASVRVKVIPGRGLLGSEGNDRAIAAVLRLIPGDVCLANQDSAGPDLLRLGDVVYINPEGYRPENLTDYGYRPNRIVIGIPKDVLIGLS